MKKPLCAVLFLFISATVSHAGLSLKPGPQLWVYSTQGNIESISNLVKSNPFDKEVLGRAMFHTLRRGKNLTADDTVEILKLLITYGADLNYKTLNGQTPLIAAVTAGNPRAVKLLLENGADASIADSRWKKAKDYADASGNRELSDLLANPPPPNPLPLAKPDLEPRILNLDISTEESTVYFTYDLVAPEPSCVKIVGSLNKGASYDMKFTGTKGDVGKSVPPGNRKRIAWKPLADYPRGIADLDIILDVVAEKCR